jgi:hypothetical protein
MLKINNKQPKNNNNREINSLFEKLLKLKGRKLKNIENLKKGIVVRIDKEISLLYAKKDFVARMWQNKSELRLQRISVIGKIMKNKLSMNLRYFISIPFIYGIIIPTMFLHIALEIYHQVCFRLWGIKLVKAKEYFVFDRRHLPYLNFLEKFNCFYCSYFNCFVSYLREIAGQTEKYWCPIKHSRSLKDQHGSYNDFVDYDDGQALRDRWEKLRTNI